MPYGAKGGDTPKHDAEIERRVKGVLDAHPHLGKVSAIKIVKAQIARHGYGGKKK